MQAIYIMFLAFAGININSTDTIKDPISWTFEVIELQDNEYQLVATADIKKGWYLYSQDNGEDGPVPTSFTFSKSNSAIILDKVKEEGELIKKHDDLFEMVISKYQSKVVFTQKYKSSNPSADIAGYVTYMTCDGLRCLPPKDLEFNVSLK